MHYVGISTYISSFRTMPVLYTHTRILTPFEDSKPTELKADTPKNYSLNQDHPRWPEKLEPTVVTVVPCTIAPHSFGGGRVEGEWGEGYGGGWWWGGRG